MEFGQLQPDSNSFEREIDLGSDSSSMEGAGNILNTHDGVFEDLDKVEVLKLPAGKNGMQLNSTRIKKNHSFVTDGSNS